MLKLYVHCLCPFVQRVIIGIQERGLESQFELCPIEFEAPPTSLLAINPSGSVPTLEMAESSGFHESLVILKYLDSLPSPKRKLYGISTEESAQTTVKLEELNQKVISVLQSVSYCRGRMDVVSGQSKSVSTAFQFLSSRLSQGNLDFLGGTEPNALDIALAPFLFSYLDLLKNFSTSELYLRLPGLQPDSSVNAYASRLSERWGSLSPFTQKIAGTRTHSDYLETKHKLFQASPEALFVKSQKRSLVPEASLLEAVQALAQDKETHSSGDVQLKSHWKLEADTKGPKLNAEFHWKDWTTGPKVLSTLVNFQECCDHHSDFQLTQSALRVSVCTHEPKWGVSEMDLAFAKGLTALLLKV